MPDSDLVSGVVAEVLRSPRHRWLASDVVTRVAATESPKARTQADAVKRTKRRLHQAFGAYLGDLRPEAALDQLTAAWRSADPGAFEQVCRHLLAQHASTRERLPVLETFYREIFAHTGRPRVLLDLACGLNPLALPWMNLAPGARYLACDADRRLVLLVRGFLEMLGVAHAVELCDLVAGPPPGNADVALLLKSVPCLERQERGSARRLLAGLAARYVVVSFSTRSLGGAARGMVEHYRGEMRALLRGLDRQATEVRFPSELVFVLSAE